MNKLNAKLISNCYDLEVQYDDYTCELRADLFDENGLYATGHGSTIEFALASLEAALQKGECGPEADGLVESPQPQCKHEWCLLNEDMQSYECLDCGDNLDLSEYALRGAE